MKHKSSNSGKTEPSRLQRELLSGILHLIRTDGLAPGTRLAEVTLAKRLQVSRTPVRAALSLLARRGLVKPGARRGYFVTDKTASAHKITAHPAPADTDLLFLAITRDRRSGKLAEEVSERDLMARFGAGRSSVREALFALQRKGLVAVRPGARGIGSSTGWPR